MFGQLTYSETAQFKDKYALITLIRESVSMWFPPCFYNLCKEGTHYALDIDEFVETEEATGHGCDNVMQFIGDGALTSYTSSPAITHFRAPESIERARANLDGVAREFG